MSVNGNQITPSMPIFQRYLAAGLVCFITVGIVVGGVLVARIDGLELDGPSLVGLVGLAIGSAIGLAGSLVVVKIADQQTQLAEKHRLLAQEQFNLSEQQTMFAAKQTVEYQALYEQAQAALQGTRQILMLYSLALATYRRYATDHVLLYGREESPLPSIIRKIEKLMLEPWSMALSRYCALAGETQSINLNHALAMLYEATHRYLVTPVAEESDDEINRKLREFMWLIYVAEYLKNTLFDTRHQLDCKLKSATFSGSQNIDSLVLNMQNPTVTAFVHHGFSTLNPVDFKISDEIHQALEKHYSRLLGYGVYQPLIADDGTMSSAFYQLLSRKFTQSNAITSVVQIVQEAGDSVALEHVRQTAKVWASDQGIPYRFMVAPTTRSEALNLLESIKESDMIHVIYVAGMGGKPSWLFEHYAKLDRCVIVFDQMPDPSWAKDYVIKLLVPLKQRSKEEIEAQLAAQYPAEVTAYYGDSEDVSINGVPPYDQTWEQCLPLLSVQAVNLNRSRIEREPSDVKPTRTIWVSLELLPDFRDVDDKRLQAMDEQIGAISQLLREAALAEGHRYETVRA